MTTQTTTTLTELEAMVIDYMAEEAMEACCADTLDEAEADYCAPCTVKEVSRAAGLTTREGRGVVSSLIQKNLVMNDNDWTSQDVPPLWLTSEGFLAAKAK